MEKRGQAAMEFLMTYGWAILAAVIAIGVLVYFGVFSPSRFVPETCVLAAPLGCADDSIVSAGTAADNVNLYLENGAGEQITVSEIDITNCATLSGLTTDVPAGSAQMFTVDCTTDPTLDDNFRGSITVTYTKASSTRTLESTGSISRKVIA